MKLSFSTVGCPEWDWPDIISAASDLGYDGIEVRGVGRELDAPGVPEFSTGRAAATIESLKKHHLELPCLASSCILSEADRKDAMLALGKAYIDTAARMQVPFVRILGNPQATPKADTDVALVAAGLSELGEYAQGTSVTLLIETNGVFADSERLLRLLNQVKRGNVGVLWDIHHPLRNYSEPVRVTYKNLAPYIRHTHIKDSVTTPEGLRYVPTGEGTVPVAECVRLLNKEGYTGYLSFEWVRRWDRTLEDAGIVFAQYVQFMRNLK